MNDHVLRPGDLVVSQKPLDMTYKPAERFITERAGKFTFGIMITICDLDLPYLTGIPGKTSFAFVLDSQSERLGWILTKMVSRP